MYLRGGHAAMPPPPIGTSETDTLLRMVFQTYNAQKYSQNAGNAVSETQIPKHFPGGGIFRTPYNCVVIMASP